MKPIHLEYEKKFVEEAVFLFLEEEYRLGKKERYLHFRSRWDMVYKYEEGRENHFSEIAAEMFQSLKLDQRISSFLKELPLICQNVETFCVRSALHSKSEGADLYHKEGNYSVVLQVRVERFLHEREWPPFVMENLLRIHDVLDPAFGYTQSDFSQAKLGARHRIVENRYQFLWLQEIRKQVASKETKRRSHLELLEEARQWPSETALCPLCSFPTTEWAKSISLELAAQIEKDFPLWENGQGCCHQCQDIYLASEKTKHVLLPGAAQPA